MAVTVRFVGSGDSFGSGGRFQTCIVVDGPATRFAIDFGASSLIALAQQGIHYYAKPIKWHLTYPAIVERVRAAGAKRLILTHMSAEMLAHRDDIPEECAADGMMIEL